MNRTDTPNKIEDERLRQIRDQVVRREVMDGLPRWVTTPLDRALALGLVADEEVPAGSEEVKLYTLLNSPVWDALQLLVALEVLSLSEARSLTPGGRVMVAYALHSGHEGTDLARRVRRAFEEVGHADVLAV